MTAQALDKSHPLAFFVLVFALSAPFWIISVGSGESVLPDNIPVTDIGATLSPLIAACVLVYRENGKVGLKRFLARILDCRRIKDKRWSTKETGSQDESSSSSSRRLPRSSPSTTATAEFKRWASHATY